MHKCTLLSAILVTTFLLLSACGGGGSTAGGGIGGTGVIASGTVTAKGSITLNGVKYEVSGARFEREDEAPIILADESETETRVGMVLEVEGELATTNDATTIRYEDIVEGQIELPHVSLGADVKVLNILSQEVVIENGLTQFDGSLAFASIESETGFIEVSGFRRADGKIQATYLEDRTVATPAGRLEVKGSVTFVGVNTFNIGGLTVNYSGTPALTVGDLVEVKGSTYSTPTLTATSVEIESPGLSISNKDAAEVEGFVDGTATINAGDTFRVDGQAVIYDSLTVFEGGTTADLVNGTKVEAEGSLSGGILTADKIEFKENIRLESNISSISGNTIRLKGLEAIAVLVDASVTDIESPLSVGDHVEVRGRSGQTASTVIATEIKNDGPDPGPSFRVILRGPEENSPVGFDTVRILGTDQSTASVPDNEFSIENDDGSQTPSNRTEFFNTLLQTGNIVKLRTDSMTSSDTEPTWEQAEIEND